MDYDLDAATGAFTWTGSDVDLPIDIPFDAAPRAFAVTGVSNGWDYDRSFDAAPGSVAVAGNFPVNIDGYVKANLFPNTQWVLINDFTPKVDGYVPTWRLEAASGVTYVPLPCQYFKATIWSYREALPFGGTNYIEVLVPSGSTYASIINAAQSFKIVQAFNLPSGNFDNLFFWFSSYLSPPIPLTKEYTKTPGVDTCLIKGAFRLFGNYEGWSGETRTLTGIRSYSNTSSGRRVVCSLDPIIQPGMIVSVNSELFFAKTISFYVSGSDQYMEVFDYHV